MDKPSSLPVVLFLALAIASCAGSIHPAAKFWYRNLAADLPSGLIHSISPLQEPALSHYLDKLHAGKGLENPSQFCKEAGLLCNANATFQLFAMPSMSYSKLAATVPVCSIPSFFRENTLHEPGSEINVEPITAQHHNTFLPKKIANAFFPKHLNTVLELLGIPPDSKLKSFMSHTISMCQTMETVGCAASLEDLVTLVSSTVGPDAKLIYSDGLRSPQSKVHHVLEASAVSIVSDGTVTCHELPFPFKIIFCHGYPSKELKVFKVRLADSRSGETSEAFAACHSDTSHWNPLHPMFLELKTSPGKSEACHLMQMIWYH